MFEAAGFSIGGAPSDEAALRVAGAAVVVWSQLSIRSRPFLDAAQRVINGGKAVVASLIEPPPPSAVGNSPAFDLSVWEGDPNDPILDSLFFAVDRMVISARAAVGVGAASGIAPPRAAPVRRASINPLDAEAEHWRTIRESRDPADFMDYLARYGAEGAFSEIAELRLKQRTEAQARTPAVRPRKRPLPRVALRLRELRLLHLSHRPCRPRPQPPSDQRYSSLTAALTRRRFRAASTIG